MTDTLPKRQRRPLVLAAVMSAMVMIAIEATIVSTAMPQIAAGLGDLPLYAWVFSAFLLTQTATTVIFGKLADTYGRKPVLLIGVAIFLLGSLLCGFAHTMPVLIAYRGLQGLGAGAIQPIALTIVGDLYPGTERGKVQGYLSSVWGVSSVLGPLAGGLIVRHLDWRWVFWINLPVGAITAFLFIRFLDERVAHTKRRIDALGAVLFAGASVSLMMALTEFGSNTALAGAALAAALVCLSLFAWQERRAADPMVALELWTRPLIASSNASILFAGMALIGLTAFLPMYVQGVLGQSALVGGFTLTAMSFGWPVGATIAVKVLFARIGMHRTLQLGAALLPLGTLPILLMSSGDSPWQGGFGSLVMGVGMGLLSTGSLVLIQGSVGWESRGAVTASNVFSRMLGSTFGAAVLGGVLNASLSRGGAARYDEVRALLDQGGTVDPGVQAALASALHGTFWVMFVVTLLAFAAAALVRQPRVAVPAQ